MATIQEELVLVDKFSATFSRYNQMAATASGQTSMASAAAANYQSVLNGLDRRLIQLNAQWQSSYMQQQRMVAAGVQSGAAFDALETKLNTLGGTIRDLNTQYGLVEGQLKEAQAAAAGASASQAEYNSTMQAGVTSAGGLTGALRGLVGTLLSVQGVKALIGLSDEMSQTSARLDRVNQQYGTAVDLNEMIYQSAQASRGAYQQTADLVGKLGTLAPDAFSGPEELVAFAEQINKQYVLAGTSAEGAAAATLQLTQALSSGTLRGEELNSVLEQAPTIVQAIGDYLGKTTGEIRELASEGQITSEVVKAAILSAAEETNAAFNEMPVTWAQRWTMMKNTALQAIQPVLSGLGWMADNIEIIGPPLLGLAGALGFVAAAAAAYNTQQAISNSLSAIGIARAAIKKGATLAEAAALTTATGAQVGLNVAMLASPVTWVVGGIMLLTGALYGGVAAFNALTGSSVSATGVLTGAFGGALAFVGNGIVLLGNTVGAFVNFFGNVFTNPVASVQLLFLNMVNNVLGYIGELAQGIQDLLNKIPGVEVDLVSGVNEGISKVTGLSDQIKADSGWKEYAAPLDYFDISGAAGSAYQWGANLFGGSSTTSGFDWETMAEEANASLGDIAGDVSSINKSTTLANEDIKSLVDMAERRYVNNINLSTQAPVITVQGQNTGNSAADRRALAETIKDIIVEQRASASLRSTARVS